MPALALAPVPSTSPASADPAPLVLVADGDTDQVAPAASTGGRLARRLRAVDTEAGMATAEYAVATVAACGFGGILYTLLRSDTVLGLLTSTITKAFDLVF